MVQEVLTYKIDDYNPDLIKYIILPLCYIGRYIGIYAIRTNLAKLRSWKIVITIKKKIFFSVGSVNYPHPFKVVSDVSWSL